MHNPLAPATMLWHKKQCHGTMHYAAAPKQHGITNSSAAAQKNASACPMLQHATQAMLWHIAPCLSISHNVVAHKKRIMAQSATPWHKKHCLEHIANAIAQKKLHGMKHNTMAQKAAHGAMLQHIMEGCGTKHNAAALITLPQNKARCCSTKAPLRHKNSATEQKMQQHKAMPQHIKKRCSTKIVPQNAVEECTMPLQKITKSKMPPTTMTAMPPRPPKPNRLIVFPPLKKTTKQQPLQKTQQPTRPKRTPLCHCGNQCCTG